MSGDDSRAVMFFDRMMVFSFYALIYFIPISNALVEIFTVLGLVGYLLKRLCVFIYRIQKGELNGKWPVVSAARLFLDSYKPPSSPLNKPVVVWLIVCFVSIFFSARPYLSFEAFLGKTLQGVFLFFNFMEAIRTRKRIYIYLLIFCVSCCLVSLSGINQYLFKVDFIRLHVMEHSRVNSTFRAPNDFAAYLVMALPMLISVILLMLKGSPATLNRQLRRFIVSTAIFALFCLGATYSRGAWLALIASCPFFLYLGKKNFLKIIWFNSVLLPIFVFKLIFEREHIGFSNLFHSFGRGTYWQEAIQIIKTKPIFGFGLNTYSIIARDFRISWGGYPHNCYLQIAAELGIIGLFSFLWIVFSAYKAFFQGIKFITDPLNRGLTVGVITGLTGFFIQITFDTFLYSVQLGSLLWVQLGLLAALLQLSEEAR